MNVVLTDLPYWNIVSSPKRSSFLTPSAPHCHERRRSFTSHRSLKPDGRARFLWLLRISVCLLDQYRRIRLQACARQGDQGATARSEQDWRRGPQLKFVPSTAMAWHETQTSSTQPSSAFRRRSVWVCGSVETGGCTLSAPQITRSARATIEVWMLRICLKFTPSLASSRLL